MTGADNQPSVKPLRVLSLGAGVQSTVVLLMSIEGELPPLDAAIFADTGWEPAAVYRHLDYLAERCAAVDLPLYRVGTGDIRAQHVAGGRTFIPFYVDGGVTRRACTSEYKIEPINRKIRDLLGLRARQRAPLGAVEQWFGISLDEVQRMRDSRYRWITNRYPLVDQRMTRWDCERWLAARGITVAKSACIGCPYHDDRAWRQMRDDQPAEFADAVAFDHAIRRAENTIRGDAYLHRSLIPLAQVDLSTPEDHGQLTMFDQECEGMCGV